MKHARAFTLIELMIVVVVIAILAAIAIPNYQSHVRKSRRQEAVASLIEIQLIEERYRTNNSSYTNDTSALSTANGGQFPTSTYYDFSVTNASSTTYTINAIAKTGQSQAQDSGCTTLTINQDSNKTPADCW